jgi:gamma-glutamyl-gamma-aminobutyrate hydrolase PuuD
MLFEAFRHDRASRDPSLEIQIMTNKRPFLVGINFNVGTNPNPTNEELQMRLGYEKLIEMAGGVPCLLEPKSSGAEVRQLFDQLPLSGLLLIGGSDINPDRYKQMLEAGPELPDPRPGDFDFLLLEEAHHRNLPVLGIGTGALEMAVLLGAKIVDVRPSSVTHAHQIDPEHDCKHYVDLTPDIFPGSAYESKRIEVGSDHRQAVDPQNIGSATVVGRADDGTVEAITDRHKYFFVGVQWHPERALADSTPLIEGFAYAVQRYFKQLEELRAIRDGEDLPMPTKMEWTILSVVIVAGIIVIWFTHWFPGLYLDLRILTCAMWACFCLCVWSQNRAKEPLGII